MRDSSPSKELLWEQWGFIKEAWKHLTQQSKLGAPTIDLCWGVCAIPKYTRVVNLGTKLMSFLLSKWRYHVSFEHNLGQLKGILHNSFFSLQYSNVLHQNSPLYNRLTNSNTHMNIYRALIHHASGTVLISLVELSNLILNVFLNSG